MPVGLTEQGTPGLNFIVNSFPVELEELTAKEHDASGNDQQMFLNAFN